MCDVVFIEEVKPFADVCKNAQFGTKEPRLLNGNDTRYCSPRYRITLVQPIPGLEVKEGGPNRICERQWEHHPEIVTDNNDQEIESTNSMRVHRITNLSLVKDRSNI
jgi:hypothetical protein